MTHADTSTRETYRIDYLDSVRGIAALAVVLDHVAGTLVLPSWAVLLLHYSPMRLMVAGWPAVALFFVLSGMVLFIHLDVEQINYRSYLIRRFFRLFPALLFGLLVSALVKLALLNTALASPESAGRPFFLRMTQVRAPTFADIAHHVLMLSDRPLPLLPPMWSLVHEWRISLVYPFLALAFVKWPRAVPAALLFLAIAMALLWPPLLHAHDFLSSLGGTVFFLWMFVGGMILARLHGRFRRSHWLLLVAGLSLLAAPTVLGNLAWILFGLGAMLVLLYCFGSRRAQTFLRHPSLLKLGDISYSLYVIHFPVALVCFRLIEPPALAGVLTVIVSVVAAGLMRIWIELPMIGLGKMLSRRWRTAPHRVEARL